MSTTIRVSDSTRAKLAALARAAGRPMTEIVDQAVGALERQMFFEALNDRFRELRGDRREWAEVQAERAVEEGALGDSSR